MENHSHYTFQSPQDRYFAQLTELYPPRLIVQVENQGTIALEKLETCSFPLTLSLHCNPRYTFYHCLVPFEKNPQAEVNDTLWSALLEYRQYTSPVPLTLEEFRGYPFIDRYAHFSPALFVLGLEQAKFYIVQNGHIVKPWSGFNFDLDEGFFDEKDENQSLLALFNERYRNWEKREYEGFVLDA